MALDIENNTIGDAETKGLPKSSLESKHTAGASNPAADTLTLTPAQHRRILIKTNCVVLVLMVTTSLMAFLDKVRAMHSRRQYAREASKSIANAQDVDRMHWVLPRSTE